MSSTNSEIPFALKKDYMGVLTIDGNNKDCPESLDIFIKKLDEGFDMIQGSRFIKGGIHKNTPILRYLAIRLIHSPILSLFSGFYWTDTTQGYRGYSRRLLTSNKLRIFRKVFSGYELLPFLNYASPKNYFKCIEVPTKRNYPKNNIPTKIKGFNAKINLLKILFNTITGKYDI